MIRIAAFLALLVSPARERAARTQRSPRRPTPPQTPSSPLSRSSSLNSAWPVPTEPRVWFLPGFLDSLRKAQRNNEDVNAIQPLFSVNIDHRGAWNGPWVATEVVAALMGILVYYLAFTAKSTIQA
ncbi:Translocon-associated protein subunit delta [Dissostichus eleginoides]|uniref:Translocon-associated protein subunit delta n=1 Tax=Dissostichus eleginoides TaxID=100907 RepID=A0AAD9CB01_DISEL|nr:Translocon-associated protein subunit delta [Dissostichus eleginoides]